MRKLSKIADMMLSAVVPAAAAEATEKCSGCGYNGNSNPDGACPGSVIYEYCCLEFNSAGYCVNVCTWKCA